MLFTTLAPAALYGRLLNFGVRRPWQFSERATCDGTREEGPAPVTTASRTHSSPSPGADAPCLAAEIDRPPQHVDQDGAGPTALVSGDPESRLILGHAIANGCANDKPRYPEGWERFRTPEPRTASPCSDSTRASRFTGPTRTSPTGSTRQRHRLAVPLIRKPGAAGPIPGSIRPYHAPHRCPVFGARFFARVAELVGPRT